MKLPSTSISRSLFWDVTQRASVAWRRKNGYKGNKCLIRKIINLDMLDRAVEQKYEQLSYFIYAATKRKEGLSQFARNSFHHLPRKNMNNNGQSKLFLLSGYLPY